MKVKARYKGRYNSYFAKFEEYEIVMYLLGNSTTTDLVIMGNGTRREYSSLRKFLDNWEVL